MIYSYDIFDTILTRIYAQPSDLFIELGRQLIQLGYRGFHENQFHRQRIQSEQKARKKYRPSEITLLHIYEELARQYQWTTVQRDDAMQAEIGLEYLSIRPIAETIAEIHARRAAGHQIVFASDMYLPEAFVVRLLKQIHAYENGDWVVVSSSIQSSKHNGKLYDYLQSLAPQEPITHKGDNFFADVEQARKHGIIGIWYSHSQLNRYEKQVIAKQHTLFASKLAGLMRSTRLSATANETNEHNKTLCGIAANVVAPLLTSYVHWLLNEALQHKIDKLFFIARDGQILYKIAQELVSAWHLPIECVYIYGSRQAWHLPSVSTIDETALNWLLDPTYTNTIAITIARLQTTPDYFSDALSAYGFTPDTWNLPFDEIDVNQLEACFLSPLFAQRLNPLVNEQHRLLISYLTQCGMLDGKSFTLVDIGWNGRLQRSLSLSLHKINSRPAGGIKGYYFALNRQLKAFDKDALYPYFNREHTLADSFLQNNYGQIIELFVQADHGTTLGYKPSGEQVEPILKETQNTSALDWGLAAYQQTIVHFAKEFAHSMKPTEVEPSAFYALTRDNLHLFLNNPSPAEALCIGRHRVYDDQAESMSYSLAYKASALSIFQTIVGKGNERLHPYTWLAGCLAISDSKWKSLLSFLLRCKNSARMIWYFYR